MIKHYSHSSTSTFRRCLYRFNELYVLPEDREDEPEIVSGTGARLGKAGHLALKAYYSNLGIQTALDYAYEEFAVRDENDMKEFKRLQKVMQFYFKVAATDKWQVLEVEKEVRTGQYMGIFDLIITVPSGQTYIVDHKFQRSKSVHSLAINNQISFYLMLARELGLKVDGLLYNIIPTGEAEPVYPVRKICFRSAAFLDNFKLGVDAQIEEMRNFQIQPKPYRNFTDNCLWDCPIKEYCISRMELK